MIEIDGVEHRTEAQWERVHRHLRKNAKGALREWDSPVGPACAVFYPRSQTKAWTKAERRREREARRAAKLEAEMEARVREAVERARDRALKEALEEALRPPSGTDLEDVRPLWWLDAPHTAHQWASAGFVPRPDAVWRQEGPGPGYWYARPWDVVYDPARAEGLMVGAPREVDRLPDGRPYDGRPWWQDPA